MNENTSGRTIVIVLRPRARNGSAGQMLNEGRGPEDLAPDLEDGLVRSVLQTLNCFTCKFWVRARRTELAVCRFPI